MKKSVFYDCPENEEAALKMAGAEGIFVREPLTSKNAEVAADAEVVSVFINSVVDKAAIDKMPALKLITTRSTGFDHIDCAYARSKGITVVNVPAYGSRTVAEYTFALILALSRKIIGRRDPSDWMGFDLEGKTIGVVGTGRIGQNAAMIAKGFGMNVIASDAFPNEDATKKIGFTYVTLDELIAKSDIVSIHAPYNPGTKHLINVGNIGKFKRGSLLINTARGEIVETAAIIKGLDEKILAGVGLDVVEGDHSELAKRPEVFMTPHIAYFTVEAQNKIAKTTVDNISGFSEAKKMNVVN